MGDGENEIKALKDVKEAFKGAIVNNLLYICLNPFYEKIEPLKRLGVLLIM